MNYQPGDIVRPIMRGWRRTYGETGILLNKFRDYAASSTEGWEISFEKHSNPIRFSVGNFELVSRGFTTEKILEEYSID